ncbi:PREDICTED: prothymosin alpha-B-like [Drosophila arizonae]|uniref:Prothymosin alpha-B-like n=1 Tax=Drosophila arizonae TaxID=7263 RepID=A0ABM1P867_DROAR|nr:PREDICTED: prothymosin alpha-B-like [Drosophila arizonae]
MICNKFLIMSIALFALVLVASAEDSGEQIADRRFRWIGSNEQEEEQDAGDENDIEEEDDAEEEEEPVEDADSLEATEEDQEEDEDAEQLDSESAEDNA